MKPRKRHALYVRAFGQLNCFERFYTAWGARRCADQLANMPLGLAPDFHCYATSGVEDERKLIVFWNEYAHGEHREGNTAPNLLEVPA